MKTFFKRLFLKTIILAESTRIENTIFPNKTALPEANVKTLEWKVQHEPITKNRVLLVTTLYFWKFRFSPRISYKELIWCTSYLNVCIHTFPKRCSFILGCFNPLRNLNGFRRRKIALSYSDILSLLLRGVPSKTMVIFIAWIIFI